MKTPREILLARHCAVEPKLDAIRGAIIADEFDSEATKKPSRSLMLLLFRCSTAPWRELVLPSRRVWAGLAAVWVLLFVINLSQRSNVSSVTGQPVRSPAVIMSWQVQQRLMAEVLADRLPSPDADRPRNITPRPHTENCGSTPV